MVVRSTAARADIDSQREYQSLARQSYWNLSAAYRPDEGSSFMTVQNDIRRYIIDELGWSGDPDTLTDDLNLIEQNVIDSLSIVELSVLLEQWYGVRVEATELVYDHFRSLGAIAAFIESKQLAVS